MGNLIRIDSRRRIIPGQARPKGKSEVLIFTGVRYERTGDPVPSSTTNKPNGHPVRGKRKRS